MSSSEIRCKGVHVKLSKEIHAGFKTRLIQHGLSMQEAFEEFARLIGSGSLSANRLLDRLVRNRVKEELASVGLKTTSRYRSPRHVNVLDDEGLYDLINEEDDDDAGEPPHDGGRNEAA